jgi:hypothetical protein
MRDQQNLPMARPALILTPQPTNPVPIGSVGFWFDGTTIFLVAADGSRTELAASQAIKLAARAGTTAALPAATYDPVALTLTANVNGALGSIDAVALALGQRLLIKDQADGTQNGLYVVTSLGGGSSKWRLTRAPDMNTSAQAKAGALVEVNEGTANGDKLFRLTTDDPITLDATSLSFALVA